MTPPPWSEVVVDWLVVRGGDGLVSHGDVGPAHGCTTGGDLNGKNGCGKIPTQNFPAIFRIRPGYLPADLSENPFSSGEHPNFSLALCVDS